MFVLKLEVIVMLVGYLMLLKVIGCVVVLLLLWLIEKYFLMIVNFWLICVLVRKVGSFWWELSLRFFFMLMLVLMVGFVLDVIEIEELMCGW